MRTFHRSVLLTAGCLAIAAGCSREAPPPPPPVATAPTPTAEAPPPPVAELRSAKATVAGLGGSAVTGEVTFVDTGNGIAIEAHVNGLKPAQKHGFHIHEIGDCSGDGSAAGPHFNPGAAEHGGPDSHVLHAGDLGNLLADPTGHATITMISRHVSLEDGAANSIVGRSVILHENEDDLTSQPAGNAGKRIACGQIELTSGGPMPSAGVVPVEASAPDGDAKEHGHEHGVGDDHEH